MQGGRGASFQTDKRIQSLGIVATGPGRSVEDTYQRIACVFGNIKGPGYTPPKILTKQRDWEMIKSRSEFYPSLWADFSTRHRKFYAGTDYEPNFRMKYKSSCGK